MTTPNIPEQSRDGLLALARKFAEESTLARLTEGTGFSDLKRNERLKAQVAQIRAGNGDNLTCVRSAYLALTDRRAITAIQEGTDNGK